MSKTTKTQARERTQHTPGPWRFQNDSFQNGEYSFKVMVDQGNGCSTVAIVPVFHHPYTGEEAANARLIAAAPALLEACKAEVCGRLGSLAEGYKWAAMYRDGSRGQPDKGLLAIIDAIAQAEGRAK